MSSLFIKEFPASNGYLIRAEKKISNGEKLFTLSAIDNGKIVLINGLPDFFNEDDVTLLANILPDVMKCMNQ